MSLSDKTIFLCAISNINSGTCNEDCKFCSQSVRYKAKIERYKQKAVNTIVQEAKIAKKNKALGFCLVSSNRALEDKMVEFVCEIAHAIEKQKLGLRLIGCNGVATKEQLRELGKNGVKAYNHNLETSREFYPNICTTHSWEDRYATAQAVNEAGLVLIAGGIFGLGESKADRVSMLHSLAELNPLSVPINFYHHNDALELNPNPLRKQEALSLVELTRKTIPNAKRIMVAGGREMMFGNDLGAVFKAGANSIVVGDYLTTKGEKPSGDLALLEQLGCVVATRV